MTVGDLGQNSISVMMYDTAMVKHGSTPLGSIVILHNPTILSPKQEAATIKADYTPRVIVR